MTGRSEPRRTFEDLEVGETFEFGPYEMSAERTVGFARRFDPQPMHLDLAGGRVSPLGGLSASGWHTAAVLMRLAYDSWIRNVQGMGSPGIDKTEWPRALMAGKTVRGNGRVLAKRASRTRPHIGLVQVGVSMREPESGADVLRAVWWMFIGRSGEDAPVASVDGNGNPRHTTAQAPSRDRAARPELRMFHLGGAEPGKAIYLGEASASGDDMVAFAREFDPQPFHLDREAAEASLFRGLSASGWHTCALWMRTNVLARQALLADLPETERLRLEHSAAIGLGFEKLTWYRPVRPGDRLHAFMTPLESRESRSRPGWGIARWQSDMTDEHGNLVLRFHPSLLMRKAG